MTFLTGKVTNRVCVCVFPCQVVGLRLLASGDLCGLLWTCCEAGGLLGPEQARNDVTLTQTCLQ